MVFLNINPWIHIIMSIIHRNPCKINKSFVYFFSIELSFFSRTIIVQNPFDDSSHSNVHSQHPVRFNQELLDNFGISIPLTKQPITHEQQQHQSTTNLIPIPTPLSNNLGINMHSINQPSLTPTIIGSYPNYDNHYQQQQQPPPPPPPQQQQQQQPTSTMYRPMMVKHNQQTPIIVRYPPPQLMPNQQYAHQMMKTRIMPPNNNNNSYATPSQVIMPQQQQQPPPPPQQQMIYDPNTIYRTNGQVNHHVPQADDNILKSLLQINPEMGRKARPIEPTTQINVPKPRKKRKGAELNTSFEDDQQPKARKRKKKGTDETDKFVEYSLQQLRDLPMLTPIEPMIDIKDDLSYSFVSEQKSKYQGNFGDIFIDTLTDFYRPTHRAPPILLPKSLSTLERHFRLCTNFLTEPPKLPAPPLIDNISEKLFEISNNEDSILSSSSIDDNDDENLFQTLSSSSDYRPLSPIFPSTQIQQIPYEPMIDSTEKVSVTLTLTTQAANNVQSVIAAVADLLKIAYPSTIDVHQSLNTNPNCTCSSKDLLSLTSSVLVSNINRSTSIYKIGRETNISIQTLIDNQPKYCRYCSQHLPNENFLKKRLNELPGHLKEQTPNGEPFVYFCNDECFNQLAQQQTVPVNIKSEPLESNLRSLPIKREEIKENKRWKRWDPNLLQKMIVQPTNTDEINSLLNEIRVPLPANAQQDKRICVFCEQIGDQINDGPGRYKHLAHHFYSIVCLYFFRIF